MFKIGNINVKPGDWIYALQANGGTVYARVCDDKFDGGCMVYWYNDRYPLGHESGWLSSSDAPAFRRVPNWAQTQFDNTEPGRAAQKFFASAQALAFQ